MKAAENEDVVIIKEQTACFTGHREIPALQLISLRRKLKRAVVSCIKDGYRFFDTILLQQLTPKFTEDEKTGSKFVSVTFRPIIQDAATSKELLGDGGADNKIKIGLVFSVTDKNGVQSDIMHWICLDTLIETVYTNNRAIMVTLTGIEAYETITIGSVLISETLGVEMTTYEKDGKTYSTIGTYDIATGTAIEA